ncbi:hypothetical protein EN935_18290 [Mesorhizobium sp. M7D.F.Ca.US.004.03.1.1]|nr:hypothetical protein EN993_11880 [Mesorhizobium sp. M7D.F.Ca.US.004.01.2.1]RVA28579.1 hypothetical protein EN935_18290 [Mesorhizobium sp. M7D.F.Ca.US.004.03.1.1]
MTQFPRESALPFSLENRFTLFLECLRRLSVGRNGATSTSTLPLSKPLIAQKCPYYPRIQST